MRLYCLANISRIPPAQNSVPITPYEKGADEEVSIKGFPNLGYYGFIKIPKETVETVVSDYKLTEICIGWKESSKRPKNYEIDIYQTGSQLYSFRMLRGFVTIPYIKVNGNETCFDLQLATSTLCLSPASKSNTPNFDLKIRAFCIRNTSTKGIITAQEEFAYQKYANMISSFRESNPSITEDDLRIKILRNFGPINLPNPSGIKVLRQKMTDFQSVIELLCDPQTGSYKNIPVNEYDPITKKSKLCRFNQQGICLLHEKETTWLSKKRTPVDKEKDKFRGCKYLQWRNITLNNKIDYSVFEFQNLTSIHFYKVTLGKSMEFWHKLASKINFSRVLYICLLECDIEELDDKFFENLSPEMTGLHFIDNDIKKISHKISRLTSLFWLNLNGNKNLGDDGFPWKSLPTSIEILDLGDTNISKIPNEIERLTELRTLNVKSCSLNHISWPSFNRCVNKMSFYGGGNYINEINLDYIGLQELTIFNLKFKTFDFPSVFRSLTSLYLYNNHLTTFNISDMNYNNLSSLIISKNGLKSFSFQNCPRSLTELDLSDNNLETIGVVGEEIDFSIFENLKNVSYKGNAIKCIPEGFENLPTLQKLDLSDNNFGHDGSDLMKVLWDRLPKTVKKLYLTKNKIHSIPCCLRNLNIQILHVAEAGLHQICPYLYSKNQNAGNQMIIDIFFNPNHKLSFIPNTIYQLPKADVQPTTGKPSYQNMVTILADEKSIRDTSRTKYNNKTVYEFKTEDVENVYACNCCAMCGNFTKEPLFEQKMAMDSLLIIKKDETENVDPYYAQLDVKMTINKPIPSNSLPVYFKPGEWRSKITSRLCIGCKEIFRTKIDSAFEEFEKNVKTEAGIKKKKVQDDNLESSSNQLQPLYNSEEVGHSTTANHLPPIGTFSNFNKQPDHGVPYSESYFDTPRNPTFNSTMEHEVNAINELGNFSISDVNPAPTSFEIPHAIVLLDQQGNQVCVWNTVNPSFIEPQASTFPEHYFNQGSYVHNNINYDGEGSYYNFNDS